MKALLTVLVIGVMAVVLFAGGFVAGVFLDRGGPLPAAAATSAPTTAPQAGGTPRDLAATFSAFWEAWDLVHHEYVAQPVDDERLMQGAIKGMMEALDDPHSRYMSPDEFAIRSTDQSGELEGIGAYVESAKDGGLRVVSPFPGSPAEAAGLLPGDLIVMVDGQDVIGMGEFEIINLVRGPAGTAVELTVVRDGHEEPLQFSITRAKIVVPSVESKLLEGGVGYVKINDFGDRTTTELTAQLRSLLDQQARGIVLDLRGNPGGWLTTAIEVSSQFLPGGTLVMRERFSDGREVTYEAQPGGVATQVPLIVLIDKGSASASEIVAGAIQDHGRGTLVGQTSYGKGSVQDWHKLQGDNGAVSVTIARWYTPEGRTIHEQGITPDEVVELTEADHEAGRDPQLDRAVELLTTP